MCEHGDTVDMVVRVPARLSCTGKGRVAVKPVDRCLAPIVRALNQAGIWTANSCCGHGKGRGGIYLHDGRYLEIVEMEAE